MTFTTEQFREMCLTSDTERDNGLTEPDDIEYFDDILYSDDPQWNLLDIYRPKTASGKLPVIVSFHDCDTNKPPHVFHCDIRSEIGRQANDDEIEFFKSFIV